MVEVQEMNDEESKKLLQRVGYGHLGLVRDTYPYVVPIHLRIFRSKPLLIEFNPENLCKIPVN